MRALDGLSVGDAFGQRFFGASGVVWARVEARQEPEPPWEWTDDTAMARVVVAALRNQGGILANSLARDFAREYRREPGRGYGTGAARVLQQIDRGVPWQTASSMLFQGSGSYGNGAAMRSAPIGAYFAQDLEGLIAAATQASQVTHFHPDGIAGGLAVALAAAWAAVPVPDSGMLEFVAANLPGGAVRRAVLRCLEIPFSTSPSRVAGELGNGSEITALDTVPFCLWNAARCFEEYTEALWSTVRVLGDRDTTCAIVGGIVASSPRATIPAHWLEAREPLRMEDAGFREIPLDSTD